MLVAYCTLGCKVNRYDTEAMRELFENAGHETVSFSETADIYIVNTCTVTNVADRKSRQMIGRAKQKGGKIIVCGCLAQRDAETIFEMEGVCAVVGAKNRNAIVEVANKVLNGEKVDAVEDISLETNFEEMELHKSFERVRAHLKICEGCDNFCTYCIVPYTRGPVRSRKLTDILEEACNFVSNGVNEIVLTGIHISSYGKDFDGEINLLDVLREVAKSGVKRIRLGSLEPTLLTDEFCAQIAKIPELCPHFHISLQSGSATVLERMGRKYTPEAYKKIVANVRKHFENPSITTDIIAGFPLESQQEHEQTVAFLKEIGFASVHVFAYSQRQGTKAADMEQLPMALRKQRAGEISEVAKEMAVKYAEGFLGKRVQVLLEEPEDDCFVGHTPEYLRVLAQGSSGEIVYKELTGIRGTLLY